MVFKTPLILLFIPIVLAVVFLARARRQQTSFRVPSGQLFDNLVHSWKLTCRPLLHILRMLVLILFLVALAGPRSALKETIFKAEGIDMVLAIDASGSMLAEDFQINGQRLNRLEIIKGVVKEFIEKRTNDRIGLVAFAGLAYTVVPLTTDYSWLEKNLERVEIGLIQDGTAIGSAIAASLVRLKESEAKSKVVILLTDGVSNAGEVEPLAAARAAASFGVKVYTIGAGSKGLVPYPAQDIFGRKVYQRVQIDLDENVMREIARITGGKYFRATDTESLRDIYQEIDQLEKTEIEEVGFTEYEELFDKVLIVALLLLLAELFLSKTILLQVP